MYKKYGIKNYSFCNEILEETFPIGLALGAKTLKFERTSTCPPEASMLMKCASIYPETKIR